MYVKQWGNRYKIQYALILYKRTAELQNCFINSLFFLKQEVIEKYESYRDLVEVLPSCQLEVQLYQKKMERQGANVERLASVLSEVCIIRIISG